MFCAATSGFGAVLANDEEVAGLAYAWHNMGRYEGRPYGGPMMVSNRRMTEWQGAKCGKTLTMSN